MKKAKLRLSKMTDTKLKRFIKKQTHSITKLSHQLKQHNEATSNTNKSISDLNQKLLGNSKYNSAKKSYDSTTNNVTKLQAKVSKSKSKKTKAKLQAELNTALKDKAKDAEALKQIANSSGLNAESAAYMRAKRSLKNIENTIKATTKRRNKALNLRERAKKIINERHVEHLKKINRPIIANKVREANRVGHTALYRTDMLNNKVYELVETSPSETDANDLATKPIDGKTVEANWISQNNRQYTATFYFGGLEYSKNSKTPQEETFRQLDRDFQTLMDWSFKYEFTVTGFSRWHHAYITSLEKSTDPTISKDGMILTITFQYARQAVIKYAREAQSHRKHKGHSKPTSGKHRGHSSNYVRVKPGMTYSQISRKTGVSVADLIKKNKYKSKTDSLPVGAKIEI